MAGLKRLTILGALLAGAAAPVPSADARFRALVASEWAWTRADNGDDAGEDADRVRAHLTDVRPAAQARRLAYYADVRRKLDAMPAARLSAPAREDAAVYRYRLDTILAHQRFRDWEMPFNSDSSFWGNLGYVARQQFRTEADYRNWLSQLAELPRWFDAEMVNMRAGAARGFTPPKVTLAGREKSLDAIADAADPTRTSLYEPFVKMPAAIPATTQAALRAQATAVIRDEAIPAYRRLRAYLRDDYIPHARTTLAAVALPDGQAWYAAQIREYATMDLTPAQIHAIGEAEIAKIDAEMDAVRKDVGFAGDQSAFLKFLRTDPRFYPTSADQLLHQAAWIAKQVDGKVGLYIGHLPRRRFAIVPVPADIAPFYTAGRGGPGQYLLNTYDLPSRPLFQLTALTLHESAPGHAMQIPLAAENRDRPPFRRRLYVSAYGEGWALYCERLGDEMGMYPTPYDRFGMLSYQAWRAARLVVDTGLHAQGWSRERAQAYLHDHTALSAHEIETEVDRYISWPGQALSYYLGEMAIRRGRAKAEAALGPRFNLRAFHDTVLATGSVPLPVLEAAIDRFIAGGGKGPYPAEE